MKNVIIILVIAAIAASVIYYLYRQKKKGNKCIGCPYAKECGGNCNNK
jgi:radical SAM protein with 4Fe4S-binding SPASM domain